MKSTGIICEYNPFHNGHLYHLKEAINIDQNNIIILVLGGNFLQRGDVSIINKWNKTKIAIEYGADIVIELPFEFASQSADIFARGSIEILNKMKCQKLVFGSESNDLDKLKEMALTQLNNHNYDDMVKRLLNDGINYPTAMAKALEINNLNISKPNDILGLSYIKEIIRQKASIEPISIKRTTNYHSKEIEGIITSATSIRENLRHGNNIDELLPDKVKEYIINSKFDDNYFKLLKYKILVENKNIKKYQTVDEGIENRILKYINSCNSLEELIIKIKTKRYTYNKLKRMFIHILCSFTKEEASKNQDLKFLRILGFSEKGRLYLNEIKKEIDIPVITNINRNNYSLLERELKNDAIYELITGSKDENIHPIINYKSTE